MVESVKRACVCDVLPRETISGMTGRRVLDAIVELGGRRWSDHFSHFVDQQLAHGRYGSASEVVRSGLRLLEEQEAKVKAQQQALIEGEESGLAERFDGEAFLTRVREKHIRQRPPP